MGRSIRWKASKEDLRWVEFSIVDVLKCLKSILSMCARLSKMGVLFEVNYLGGLKTLWSFHSDEDRRDFLLNRFIWDNVMEYVEDQGSWSISATKTRWIRLLGFPVKVWCPSFLKAVSNSFRITLHVEDRVALVGKMDYCWILVSIAEEMECPTSVLVETENGSFRVVVQEVSEAPSKN